MLSNLMSCCSNSTASGIGPPGRSRDFMRHTREQFRKKPMLVSELGMHFAKPHAVADSLDTGASCAALPAPGFQRPQRAV